MTCTTHSDHNFVEAGELKRRCTKCGLVTCDRPCSPGDYHIGGKCDLSGCMEPRRIQLKRTKGWRMPSTAVKVDRTTKWGNPYVIRAYMVPQGDPVELQHPATKEDVIDDFTEMINGRYIASEREKYPSLEEIRTELKGKHLACWCREGTPCHADILLKIANS